MAAGATYKDANHRAVKLGPLVAAPGGEGAVHEVVGNPEIVAKIYHKPISATKADKLKAMIGLKTERLLKLTAWPSDLLFNANGQLSGFVMPRILEHKDIHTLYTPKSRKDSFPSADWRFLVHTAANVARSFAMVHEHGCVIGDVNHGSVLASNRATVRLIDCDSFQITAGEKQFLCEVGVATYTPPELQGQSFKTTPRTPNHDAFGLAVMIFHLLFMGRHPFAGRFLGRGEMPIEKAIQEFRFAYGSQNKVALMEPPPQTLPMMGVSQPVTNLFERAFSRQGVNSRPTAREWIIALEGLEKHVKPCPKNASHHYYTGLPSCPWCDIEAKTGAFLFYVSVHVGGQTTGFNVAAVWTRIQAVPAPPPAPSLPPASNYVIRPSAEAVSIGASRKIRKWVAWAIMGGSIFAVIASGGVLWFVVIIAWFVFNAVKEGGATGNFKTAFISAENAWKTVQALWHEQANATKFNNKLAELRQAREQLNQLPALRQNKYRQLEMEREKSQRARFLDQFLISRANIKGIGPGRTSTLESYNIETALDVDYYKVMRVPGFGPNTTKLLVNWRKALEQRFRFDASKGVDPRDIADLDKHIATLRVGYEKALLAGPAELTQIRRQIVSARETLWKDVESTYKSYLQADMNKKTAEV